VSAAVLTAWLLLAGEPALPDTDLAQQAHEAFADGLRRREAGEKPRAAFRKSASLYEELRRRGAGNGPLYRSLGNARLLAGDLAGAILAYREGLRVAPDDPRLRECLEEARGLVAFRQGSALGRPPEDYRPPWLPGLGSGPLLALAALAYAGGCVLLTRWRMVRRAWLLPAAAALLAAAAALAVGLLGRDPGAGGPVVVLSADGVLLRKGDGPLYPPRFDTPLGRGVEARLLARRGGWLQVELAGGEVGWVARKDAVVEGEPEGTD
jgi:hypothetical protein